MKKSDINLSPRRAPFRGVPSPVSSTGRDNKHSVLTSPRIDRRDESGHIVRGQSYTMDTEAVLSEREAAKLPRNVKTRENVSVRYLPGIITCA